jgi:predicted HTH domain antitoxin
MTLAIELPDAWRRLLGLDGGDAAVRAREMLVLEGYREGRLSRGQAAEMLGLGFHEAEVLFRKFGAEQQPSWEDQQQDAQAVRELLKR